MLYLQQSMGPVCHPFTGEKDMTSFLTIREKSFDNTSWNGMTRRKEIYERCNFNNTLMHKVQSDDIIFRESVMDHAEWRASVVNELALDRCFAPNINFSDDTRVSGLRIYDSIIDGASFVATGLEGCKIETPVSALRLSFVDCEIENMAFLEADMRGAMFHNCKLKGLVFRQVNMETSVFHGCSFENCVFVKTNLLGCLIACCKNFESSRFIRGPMAGVRLYDRVQAEKASISLLESALKLEFKENFLNYDLASRPSMSFAKDLSATADDPKHKSYLLKKAAEMATSSSLVCGGWGPDHNTVYKRPSTKARLFFSPGLKEMMVS